VFLGGWGVDVGGGGGGGRGNVNLQVYCNCVIWPVIAPWDGFLE
jgi:hypothetical protein